MIPLIFCLALAGLVCGLLLLHWLQLAFLCILLSMTFFAVAPWDWMLIPKWIGLLTAVQLPYLAGAALRVWRDRSILDDNSREEMSEELPAERAAATEDDRQAIARRLRRTFAFRAADRHRKPAPRSFG